MEFEDFTNKMIGAVKERMGEDYRVFVRTEKKNNNIELTGLVIADGESGMVPVIYLEPFYYAVEDGRKTLEQAASDIVGIYQGNRPRRLFDVSAFAEFGTIKGKIRARLINTERNTDFLAAVPHREYMDLSMIYTVILDCGDGRQGSITVKNGHMEQWGVTEQELFEQAESNAEAADDMEAVSMAEIFRQMAGDKATEEAGITDSGAVPMYVVTNKNRWHGAVAMLNRKVMGKAAEILGRDLIILPSSIHEVLVIPASNGDVDLGRVALMVKEVNATEVAADEVLSEHVYRYDSQTGEIAIAA